MSELRGYTLPLSPGGGAALVPAPPWHFSGEVLIVEYLTDPSATAAFMPDGVQADPAGRAAAIVGSWQSATDGGGELADPVRSQYMEFYVALACTVGGRAMMRCAFCWVDKDFSLVRGLVQGYPKKLGSIHMTRPVTVGKAGPRLRAGAQFAATLAANDRRLADLHVELRAPASDPPVAMTAPLVHTRLMPPWAHQGQHVAELVTGGSRDQETADLWHGTGTVEYHSSPWEELDRLAPIETLDAWRLAYAETLDGGELVNGEAT